MKKVSMELGGNAPFIVFDDADLRISSVLVHLFLNLEIQGRPAYVQIDSLFKKVSTINLLKNSVKRFKTLNVGHGMDEGVNQGPLISLKALDKVKDHS
jgi:succinate-semialdehyde dehydrogenase/glutarate-semialdehyde dehydrogenase